MLFICYNKIPIDQFLIYFFFFYLKKRFPHLGSSSAITSALFQTVLMDQLGGVPAAPRRFPKKTSKFMTSIYTQSTPPLDPRAPDFEHLENKVRSEQGGEGATLFIGRRISNDAEYESKKQLRRRFTAEDDSEDEGDEVKWKDKDRFSVSFHRPAEPAPSAASPRKKK